MLFTGSDVVAPAYAHGFAVPAYNISDFGMLTAVLAASEEVGSPVILLIHPDDWAFVGDQFLASVFAMARSASVPVAIKLDHGATVEQAAAALRHDFTSVMIDGSLLPFEENIAVTRTVVEMAHLVGVSVEGEIGTIGPRDPRSLEEMQNFVYADPGQAKEFVDATGVDMLAVAVGTAHGVYPPGFVPELKLDLIERITDTVGIPLVLHGGSGAVDSEVSEAVKRGVAKVNISADMKTAYFTKLREVLADPAQREPLDICPPALAAVRDVVRHKAAVLGAEGGADHYGYRPAGVGARRWVEGPATVQQ
ncbi:ketose-bisphosphate aldolase [Serinibacter arcticus]|uniref:Fructose-bisphosphate aldolase class II n=1 Tax=Serinibacter arcticus TaxID=1655435 RepID=A0A4Z1E275_9MICO|nr:ketose-bisphosphate aldolase [Serinibacter arcticus]TGO05118.1 Fructose-bisphosphate aldolase class II [Serinibacter arcticus]